MPRTQTTKQSPVLDYARLFRAVGEAYLVFAVDDPAFTVLEENNAHERMANSARSKIVGKSMFEAFPSTSKQYAKTGVNRVVESLRKVIRTGRADTLAELEYDTEDTRGKLVSKYWRITHHPIKDDAGKVIAICQNTEDITEAVQTGHALERAKSQLDHTLSNSSIGTWQWDVKQNKVYMDKNFSHLFGLDPDKAKAGLSPSSMVASIHPDDQPRVSQETQRALKQRSMFESEYRTIDADGEVRWVIARGHVEHDAKGVPIHFPGVVIDITERKNAENNLNYLTQASTQFSASFDYRETLRSIAAMVVPHLADWCTIDLLDEDGQLEQVAVVHKDPKKVAWAKALRKKQGPMSMDAPTGAPKVIRTGEPDFFPVITDEMLVAAAKDKQELELLRGLGFSSAITVPMRIDGKGIGALTLIATESRIHYKPIDLEVAIGLANRAALAVYNANLYQRAQKELKERERLQEQLEIANSVLESRVRERTEQLQMTNQGLRTEILKRHEIEDALQENSKNLARSNQELQDFAYVASHDLQEPLRKIQAFGNLLETEYGEALGEGADYLKRMRNAASRMSTLIEDLLSFSRVTTKASPSVNVELNKIVSEVVSDLEMRINDTGGVVEAGDLPSVMADPTHMRQLFQNLISNALKFHKPGIAPKVKIQAKTAGNHYRITVSDNGIGFDAKYVDRIFAVFQRLHDRDAYDGTGIGLAVCRKIVERYGGTITATSTKGKGAKFTITLPKKGGTRS